MPTAEPLRKTDGGFEAVRIASVSVWVARMREVKISRFHLGVHGRRASEAPERLMTASTSSMMPPGMTPALGVPLHLVARVAAPAHETQHLVAVRREGVAEVAADEARRAGDEDAHTVSA